MIALKKKNNEGCAFAGIFTLLIMLVLLGAMMGNAIQ